MFLQFKPNTRYIYCCQNISNQRKIIDSFIFDDVLKNAIEAPKIDKLTKWNCLLNCSMSKLCSINQEIIHSIFNDAVKAGDYDVMYDLLDNQAIHQRVQRLIDLGVIIGSATVSLRNFLCMKSRFWHFI